MYIQQYTNTTIHQHNNTTTLLTIKLTDEQLMMSSDSILMDFMPTVNNIVYQDVLVLIS